MRHARETPAQRRGGESTGSAWPSIVATTTSIGGAAAGLVTLALWTDTFHLRLGVGMAAAGAVYSSIAMIGRWREKNSLRDSVAAVRADSAAEMRFEIGRRDGHISSLKLRLREAEETVLLFEQRARSEQARADAADVARVRIEYDYAVLTAWVQQTQAAAEITRAAVQSLQTVQPFEPLAASSTSSSALQYAEYDITPVAAVPAAPVHQTPAIQSNRPLRSAVLAERTQVGFDVASNVNSASRSPYLVPGVSMPRYRGEGAPAISAASPSRPIAPERLYRPYLTSGAAGVVPNEVDLTAFDDTTQFSAVEQQHRRRRRSG